MLTNQWHTNWFCSWKWLTIMHAVSLKPHLRSVRIRIARNQSWSFFAEKCAWFSQNGINEEPLLSLKLHSQCPHHRRVFTRSIARGFDEANGWRLMLDRGLRGCKNVIQQIPYGALCLAIFFYWGLFSDRHRFCDHIGLVFRAWIGRCQRPAFRYLSVCRRYRWMRLSCPNRSWNRLPQNLAAKNRGIRF